MHVNYNKYIQTEEWRQRAEAAKQRVGNRCQLCNRPSPRVILEAHHRTYERLGNELPEDLTVLCRSCHELYEANRRMPRPPQAQPAPPLQKVERMPLPPQQQPVIPLTRPSVPFAPAAKRRQAVIPTADQFTLDLDTHLDSIYQVPPDLQTDQPNSVYYLTPDQHAPFPAQPRNPIVPPSQNTYQPRRRRQMGLAALVVLLLFILLAWFDFRLQTSLSVLLSNPTPTDQPVTIYLPLPTPPQAQTTAIAIPTLAPLTPTLAPATPTLTPTPLPLIATPAYVDNAPAIVQRWIVNQTALVCGNPCSCAPVVRTITSGTAVRVLETARCRSDTWYKIADGEWLGPRLLDDGAVATTAVP